jgi:6-pyruvoyltetrahydropterin/6-carboxytetrahydropterin synthase
MFTLALKRRFVARHFLIGGDWGAENHPHDHAYQVEVQVESERLDAHGYVIDLVDFGRAVDEEVARFRDRTLNDSPEFTGVNPSLEHFARILAVNLNQRLNAASIRSLEVHLWEHEAARASFHLERGP